MLTQFISDTQTLVKPTSITSPNTKSNQPTSFLDNLYASYQATKYNSNTFSKEITINEQRDFRNKEIEKITGQKIDDIYQQLGGGTSTHSQVKNERLLDEFINNQRQQNPDTWQNVSTRLELIEKAKQKALDTQNKANQVASRSTTLGMVGGFVGAMGSAVTDPVNIATMFIGAGAASTATKAILTEVAIGAAAEAVIQPKVMAWAQETGQEYGYDDFLTNVALGGVLNGAFEAGQRGVKALVNKYKPKPSDAFQTMADNPNFTATQREELQNLADYQKAIEASPVKLTNDVDKQIHFQNLQKVLNGLNQGKNLSEIELSTIPSQTKLASDDIDITITPPPPTIKADKLPNFIDNADLFDAEESLQQELMLFTRAKDFIQRNNNVPTADELELQSIHRREIEELKIIAKNQPDLELQLDDDIVIKASELSQNIQDNNEILQAMQTCAL